ncbi:MAG: DciA family protein, partial [Smithella sp.]
KPDGWREGTLFVKTTSSVWVQQLHFMKEDIRQKINDLSRKQTVKEIMFTVGYNPAPENAGQSATGAPKIVLRERDKKMIAECTGALADQELAEIVKRVMKMEISRRRLREAKQGH